MAMAKTITLAKINLHYGFLKLPTGEARILASIDENNQLTKMTLDVNADFFYTEERTRLTLNIDQLNAGEQISYAPGEERREALVKIRPLQGFNKNGGLVKVYFQMEDRYESQIFEVAREKKTKRFFLWRNKHIVRNFEMNLLGLGIENLFINWFNY